MYKQLILLLLLATPLAAQNKMTEHEIDSLSFGYYYNGDWNKLIELGKMAELYNIKFKYLEQRLGYANFMSGNYYATITHYENALKYDKTDQISHSYLYYAATNLGDEEMAQFHASQLTDDSRKLMNIKPPKLFNALDLEYNYKLNNSDVRSNPDYTRVGLNLLASRRLSLYQSVSRYNQTNDVTTRIQQDEYFVRMSYALFSRTAIHFAYHYLHTKLDDPTYNYLDTLNTNLFLGAITRRSGRFDWGISSSFLTGDSLQLQLGAQLGVLLPGKIKPYLKSSLYSINSDGTNRIVFSQSAGFLLAPKLWIQADLTLGNLKNYVDNSGLYVYNSLDPTTFRTAGSLFWYLSPKITGFTNYTFDTKLIQSSQTTYYQHSFSGGLIWKL